MQAFALRLGMALHYEILGFALPDTGRVAARWFTNYEHITRRFPDDVLEFLGPPKTLQQGKFCVSDQFQYSWAKTPEDTAMMTLTAFRLSFAVLAFTTAKAEFFPQLDDQHVYGPRAHLECLSRKELGGLLPL